MYIGGSRSRLNYVTRILTILHIVNICTYVYIDIDSLVRYTKYLISQFFYIFDTYVYMHDRDLSMRHPARIISRLLY